MSDSFKGTPWLLLAVVRPGGGGEQTSVSALNWSDDAAPSVRLAVRILQLLIWRRPLASVSATKPVVSFLIGTGLEASLAWVSISAKEPLMLSTIFMTSVMKGFFTTL